MSSLTLIRHAETQWNVERRYQGHSDIPLNPTGVEQAICLGNALRGQIFHAAYSSDLGRAADTARAVVAVGLLLDERLRELKFGAWEGLTHAEIAAQDPAGLQAWYSGSAPPGGESLEQFAARVADFWKMLRARCQDDTSTLVVAHGGTLRVLLCLALGLPIEKHWQFKIEAATVSRLDVYETGAILSKLNDDAHLRR